MEEKRSLEQLAHRLREVYAQDPHIERLFYPEHPLPLASCYLDLALIDEHSLKIFKEKEEKKEAQNPEPETLLRDYERVAHSERKLAVQDILKEAKQTPRRIYIEGGAGAGKSTLSRYIAYQWSQGQAPWNQYQWVFYIRLRELSASKYTEQTATLRKVIERECFQWGVSPGLMQEEVFKLLLRSYPNQVLFVLDGYDELQLTTNYIRTLWDDLLLSQYDLLITSRPGIYKSALKSNLNLGVLGLSDSQVEQYIHRFFDPCHTPGIHSDNAKMCLTTLRSNPNLWSLAHIPIQLELLCSLWGHELKQPELRLTTLYQLMVDRLLKRYHQRVLSQQGMQVLMTDIDSKPLKQTYEAPFAYMEYLAFLGMQAKMIVLQEAHMNEAYRRLRNAPQAVGFYKILKGIGLLRRSNNGSQAEFAHLTFQEFFAARFIARAIKAFCEERIESLGHDDLLAFIARTKWDPFYEVMWWFVAGLLAGRNSRTSLETYHYRSEEEEKPEIPTSHRRLQRLQTFFDLLLQEPRLELGFQEVTLLARCLEEAQLPEVMQKSALLCQVDHWSRFYYYHEEWLRQSSLAWLDHVLRVSSGITRESGVLNRIKEIACGKPAKWERNTGQVTPYGGLGKGEALAIWGRFASTFFDPEVITVLLPALQGKDSDVRYPAVSALMVIGPVLIEPLKSEVVTTLLRALQDKDRYVKSCAAKVLGALGSVLPDPLKSEVVTALLQALQDEAYNVRATAAKAMSMLGSMLLDSQKSEVVMAALLRALQDEENYVSWDHAARVLGNLRSPLINFPKSEVVIALLRTLQDKENNDVRVRASAARALGKLGAKLIDPRKSEVVMALLRALQDEKNNDVGLRASAAGALGRLGAALMDSLKSEVVMALLRASQDNNYDVTAGAVKALNRLVSALTGPLELQVITALLQVFQDKKSDLSGLIALQLLAWLGSMLTDPQKSEVVTALLRALQDEESDVRVIAASVLGKLGSALTKPLKLQVIPALLRASQDKEGTVRGVTAEAMGALGSMLPEPSKSEVVMVLLRALQDEESKVRRSAAKALGRLGAALIDPQKSEVVMALLRALQDEESDVKRSVAKALGILRSALENYRLTLQQRVNEALLKVLLDPDIKSRKKMLGALIQLDPLTVIRNPHFCPIQPPYLPPSRLITSAKEVVKVDEKGCLNTLTLCGMILQSMLKDAGHYLLTEDHWALAIVRKQQSEAVIPRSNASRFFSSVSRFTNGLFDHAFLVLEGIQMGVRFATKIDLYAMRGQPSQSSGQRIQIEITEITDFNRLQRLADHCSCIMQGISKTKAEQLLAVINRDQADAAEGKLLYRMSGDGSAIPSAGKIRYHSCISWCLEKWQVAGLPLKRRWYDAIVVVSKAYLPDRTTSSNKEKCLLM